MPASSPPTRRVVEVIELLAEQRDRAPRLNDLVKALGLNQATAHAILAELSAAGWVSRDPIDKTYALGATLVGLAARADGNRALVHTAHAAALRIAAETGYAVSVSERIESSLVVRAFVPATRGIDHTHEAHRWRADPGDRFPLAAPFGPAYIAWEPEHERSAWIRRSGITNSALLTRLCGQLDDTRERGYSIEHLSPDTATAIPIMTSLQTRTLSDSVRGNLDEILLELTAGPAAPDHTETAGKRYVGAIAAPIFDHTGHVVFNLCVHPFTPLRTHEVTALGSVVTESADMMQPEAWRARAAVRPASAATAGSGGGG